MNPTPPSKEMEVRKGESWRKGYQQGIAEEQARIEKEVEKMFNNFHIKTFPHSTESAKELKHQKEIILEVWENMIKPVIQGEVLSIIRNK